MRRREAVWHRVIRRTATVPLYLAATLLASLAAPLLLPLCWLASLHRRMRGALRTYLFLAAYLWCETAGIVVSVALWLRYGLPTRARASWPAFLGANFALQCAWASALQRAAARLFELRFHVTGTDALDGEGALMLPRHASIADTVIPMVFYAAPRRVRLRYVLKRELLLDPCLDIVGNRLPNAFVTRGGDATDIERLTELAGGLMPDEGLLIYPEGTRFSTVRRERIIAALAGRLSPNEFAMVQRWPDLLPPRIGGTWALASVARRDLVFCAHVGFEGATHFRTLVNGGWLGAQVRIHFWRVPYANVPRSEVGFRAFLFAQWNRMQETLRQLRGGTARG